MNQNMNPQRPPQQRPQGQPQRAPQRPPQGQPQRPPQGRPPQRPQGQPPRQPQKPNRSPYTLTIMIALIVTGALLVLSIVGLCIALAISGGDSGSESSGGGGGGSVPQQNQQTTVPQGTQNVIKAKFLTLPSKTPAGSYSYSAANATNISGDSQIQSTAAALIDVTNGRAVAAKNGDQKVYPASMTKVMTLLVACENAKDPTALLTLTEEMVTKYKNSYTSAKDAPSLATQQWAAGIQVTVEDALYMVIYKSDTYACWLLADYIAGSEAKFVQMMNDRASSLGLSGTHFENCTGLYSENHYTTCLDMATIMAVAMSNPAAEKVLTSNTSYTADLYINGVRKASAAMYSGWYTGRLEEYPYGQAAPKYAGNGSNIMLIAGKTGYETIPKYCFVTAGKNDETGTLFVCVQVGGASPKESTDDTREIYQQYADY